MKTVNSKINLFTDGKLLQCAINDAENLMNLLISAKKFGKRVRTK